MAAKRSATTFEIDSPGFKRQVDKLAKKYGTSARALMLDQMRLWMNDLVRKTPPKTLAVGRRAVANDISKVFYPVMEQEWLDVLRTFNDPELFDVELEDMMDIHKRWRGRDGRVRQGPRGTRAFGGIKTSAKAHVTPRDYRKYLQIKQSHVGSLKAGWVPGVKKFKGKAPNFVMRHKIQRGAAIDKMKKTGDGYLAATNRVLFKPKKVEALIKATGNTRRRDISKNLEKRIVDASAQANKGM